VTTSPLHKLLKRAGEEVVAESFKA